MNNKIKNFSLLPLVMMVTAILLPVLVHAQIGNPDEVPIDGGLSLLLAAGAAYGVKKYRDGRKKQAGEETDLK